MYAVSRTLLLSMGMFSSVQFSSVEDGISAPWKAHILRSTPSLGSFPNVALETQFQLLV